MIQIDVQFPNVSMSTIRETIDEARLYINDLVQDPQVLVIRIEFTDRIMMANEDG